MFGLHAAVSGGALFRFCQAGHTPEPSCKVADGDFFDPCFPERLSEARPDVVQPEQHGRQYCPLLVYLNCLVINEGMKTVMA